MREGEEGRGGEERGGMVGEGRGGEGRGVREWSLRGNWSLGIGE